MRESAYSRWAACIIPKPEAKERDLPEEREMLVGAVSGPRFGASWVAQDANMGFFDAKGALEYAFAALGIDVAYEASEDSILQTGRAAKLTAGGVTLGVIGELQSRVLDHFDLDAHPAAMFEINMDALLSAVGGVSLTYQSSSRYPESYRGPSDSRGRRCSRIPNSGDNRTPRAGGSQRAVRHILRRGRGRRSQVCRIRFVFQSDRGTLTSEQVDRFQNDILRQLSRNLNAELRG